MKDLSWMDAALCADPYMVELYFGEPVNFFPDAEGDPEQYKKDTELAQKVCAQCPVRRECIEYALENEERFGIWGGADEQTLRRALGVDQWGKPATRQKSIKCPYCLSKALETVQTKRTRRMLRCTDCDLQWWSRTPATIIKIDADAEDDSEDDPVSD